MDIASLNPFYFRLTHPIHRNDFQFLASFTAGQYPPH